MYFILTFSPLSFTKPKSSRAHDDAADAQTPEEPASPSRVKRDVGQHADAVHASVHQAEFFVGNPKTHIGAITVQRQPDWNAGCGRGKERGWHVRLTLPAFPDICQM